MARTRATSTGTRTTRPAQRGLPVSPRRGRAGKSDVSDPSLATKGEGRIAWAHTQMPVLAGVRGRFGREKPLKGVRIAASLHVTAETANLVRTLTAGGASVA